jgi:hypothetical protein
MCRIGQSTLHNGCTELDYPGAKGCAECLKENSRREDEIFADAFKESERIPTLSREEIDAELEQTQEYFDRFIAGDRPHRSSF